MTLLTFLSLGFLIFDCCEDRPFVRQLFIEYLLRAGRFLGAENATMEEPSPWAQGGEPTTCTHVFCGVRTCVCLRVCVQHMCVCLVKRMGQAVRGGEMRRNGSVTVDGVLG